MSDPQPLASKNENSLQELAWAIATSQEEFSLILALCNGASLRRRLMQSLQASSDLNIREIVLDKSIKKFFHTIQNILGSEHPQALVVSGLESVNKLEQVLSGANQVREEFRKNFHFPLVLWVTDDVLHKLMRLAPDLHSWSTIVEFAIATDDLIDFIQQTADEVFEKVLAAGAGRYLDSTALNLQVGSPRRVELESAWHDLQNRRLSLNPELEASLEFMLGRANSSSLELSGQYYERSLALFVNDSPSPSFLERRACLLYSLGLWWRTYAVLHHPERDRAIGCAKDYFQECIELFEQANRQDLVAKFINALGSVLQDLQEWQELEAVANKAIVLHQTYPNQFKLARAYGFLAEVLIAKSAWNEAKQTAEQALSLLDSVQIDTSEPVSEEMKADLDWERSYHRGWYLFALARSQSALNQPEAALQTLETARTETKAQYDPELYIRILAELRANYFKKGKYLTAFHLKQEQRSLEQQYGFRAFIGAGRLQAQQTVNNPALASVEQQETVATEIAASGRQQDINRLIERMGQHDRKLTIIHGQSGVGKSSILQAGLIPALKQRSIGVRDVLPVLQQVYPDWIIELGNRLRDAISDLPRIPYEGRSYEYSPPLREDTAGEKSILNQLEKHDDYNLLTVLIFDQFEEFFFIYNDPSNRRKFYEFLRDCLDIPYIKVILSLREDYLHYLLECNNRLANFDVISNNILDKDILYHLDNFSLEDAKLIIQNLTQKSQSVLEAPLIDELVKDLARDLGEVRPIELQVVGAQLQTEKITKLEQYQQHGPKEKFVGRFLEEIVQDCGSDNEQIAKLVLYLLTDEKNTRPLKTRADLELELDVKTEKLDLILEILVKSGLVLRVPASPADRYQLVHDYLVPFVRQQQSARLIAELEKEREQRKLTEAKLNEVLQQQLLETRRGLVWKVALGAIVGGLTIFLPLVLISQNNANLYSMTQESKSQLDSNKDLEALVESLKAGKRLQQWWSIGAQPETQMKLLTTLQDVVYETRERNSLEGYKDTVTCVSFSHDSQRVVTGTEDGTLKIWSRDGREIYNSKVHNKKITSVSFSRDDQMIAAGTVDGKVLLISWDSKKITNFQGYDEEITSINFSPDGQKLISASKDKTFKLWNLKGEVIQTFKGHKESITSVSFSPDGQLIVSGSEDNMVKLWTLNGKAIKTLNQENPVTEVTFSPDGQTIASTGGEYTSTKLWRRNGSLIKTLSSSGRSVSFSLDSKSIALTSFSESEVSVEIDQIDAENIGTIFELKGHGNKITSVSVSPDFQMLASGSEDRTVKLWSLEKDKDFKNPDESVVNNVSFSPNSQLIASVSGQDNVRLWEQDGTLKTTLPGHNSQVSFSPDSQMLVTASEEHTVQLWRRNGTFIKTLYGDVVPGSFSPDGRTIALVQDDNRVELSTSDGKHIATLKGDKNRVNQITFSPNSEFFATFDENKTIKVWQRNGKNITIIKDNNSDNIGFSNDGEILAIQNGKNLRFWQRKSKIIKSINNLEGLASFSPDGELIAIFRRDTHDNNLKIKLELWRIDGTLLTTISEIDYSYNYFSPFRYSSYFTKDSQVLVNRNYQQVNFWRRDGYLLSKIDKPVKSFSPDLQTLATIEEKNNVKLWKSNGTFLKNIQVKTKKAEIKSVNFNHDGQTLVIQTNKNTVEIWRQDGTWLKTITGLNDSNTKRLATEKIENKDDDEDDKLPMSFSDKNLAIRTQENKVQLWKIDGKTSRDISRIKTINNQGNWVKEVNFINNTDTIAIVSGIDVVKIWQIPIGIGKEVQLLQSLKGHTNQITSLSISPDGQFIASASKDNTVKLWQRDGKLLKTFTGHKDNVNSISFSPDSQLIASASDDKTVKVWQLDGKMFMSFDKHENGVNSVNFSPDGKMIASASKDRTVRVWNLEGKERKNLNTEEPVNKVSFRPDGQMIASASYKTVKLSSIDGTLLATFSDRFGQNDVSFSPDGKTIAAPFGNGISVWNFNLKELLKRGCNEAHDYLKNNPKAESDRYLCDDIYKRK
ncbi:nSTAND1 domain-containing NTPase [Nostoc sp.]|uniref:WD40 domain-containing protein n=1 Tax=Nostoc sp. TaxID=1180 RepID=UPI002FF6DF6F